jgi:hypothetical protein
MEPHELDGLAELVRRRLAGRIRDLRLALRGNGIVLQGRACSYYGKQLAQHEVLRVVNAARLVNEIEVSPIASCETDLGGELPQRRA